MAVFEPRVRVQHRQQCFLDAGPAGRFLSMETRPVDAWACATLVVGLARYNNNSTTAEQRE